MAYLALDPSTETGWALWFEGDIRPLFKSTQWVSMMDRHGLMRTARNWRVFGDGHSSIAHGIWTLKSQYTPEGGVWDNFHQRLADLFEVAPFHTIFYEEAVNLHGNMKTSAYNIELALGLQSHILSFAHRFGCKAKFRVNPNTWPIEFNGKLETRETKRIAKEAREKYRDPLKELTKARCRSLGFHPKDDGDADAIGILTFGLMKLRGITPPWIADEVLRPMLAAGGAR